MGKKKQEQLKDMESKEAAAEI